MSQNDNNGFKRMKPVVAAIIQARMGSTRLPGKSLLDLAGYPMLYHVIERTMAIEGVDNVVVATSIEPENKQLVELSDKMGVHSFVGSPENVLERYFFASIEFDCDYIIRVTGDNPFIDVDYGSMALDIALESGADLCSISNLPLGIAIEIIKKEALHETYKMSDKDYHFEHVTTFIKEHSELFHIERHQANFNPPFENLRLTVDTPEDYQLAKTIYEALYQEEPFSLAEVMKFLEKNPKLASINKKVNQRTMYHSSNAR